MTLIETIEGSDSNAITAHKAKHQLIKCDNFIFISKRTLVITNGIFFFRNRNNYKIIGLSLKL